MEHNTIKTYKEIFKNDPSGYRIFYKALKDEERRQRWLRRRMNKWLDAWDK